MKRLFNAVRRYTFFFLGMSFLYQLWAAPVADQAVTEDDSIIEARADSNDLVSQGKSLKVFFLGNSYTVSAGGQPHLVKAMLESRGYAPEVQTYIRAGETLEGFWLRNAGTEPTYYEKKALERLEGKKKEEKLKKIEEARKKTIGALDKAIAAQQWDLVIIQSWTGAKMPEQIGFVDYVGKIVKTFRETSPEARIVLYMTWGSQNKPEEQDVISDSCYEAARKYDLIVAPAGEAAWAVKKSHPDLMLHRDPKDSHPGCIGAYLAACTIFTAITETTPIDLPTSMMIPVSYDFPYTVRTEGYSENFRNIDKKKPVEWKIDAETASVIQKAALAAFEEAKRKLAAKE